LIRCANRIRFLPTRPSVRSNHRRKLAEGMKDKTARSGRSSDRSDSKGRLSRKARQVGGVQRPGVIARPCRLALRRKSKRRPEGKRPAYIDGAPRERRHKRRREPRSKPAKTKRGHGREAVQTRLALNRPSDIRRRKLPGGFGGLETAEETSVRRESRVNTAALSPARKGGGKKERHLAAGLQGIRRQAAAGGALACSVATRCKRKASGDGGGHIG